MITMLYHVSPTAGLQRLEPKVSTHGKAYVYATESLVTGLLFGAKWDDFDFELSTDEQGRPVLRECYPDAFRTVYQGKDCYVYIINEEGFERGRTSWETELVCEGAVEVQAEQAVADLYERLLDEEAQGNLIINRYGFITEYRKAIAAHIVDRIIRFDIDLDRCTETDQRFATHYKKVVDALRSATDGHLLS